MSGKIFESNDTTLPVIEEPGKHMPGGVWDRTESDTTEVT